MVAAVQIELLEPVPILDPLPHVEAIAGVKLEPGGDLRVGESRCARNLNRVHDRTRLLRHRTAAASGSAWRAGAEHEGAAKFERPRAVLDRRGSDLVERDRLPHEHPRDRAIFEVVGKDQVERRAERLLDGQMLGGADVLGHEIEVRGANPDRVEAHELSREAQDIGRRGGGREIVGLACPASTDRRPGR